jgi:3-dehydroquinate synthase
VELKESVKHGFAVAAGMEFAADFSFKRGIIPSDDRDRIINLLERFALLGKYNIPVEQIEQLILHDKKKTGSEIHFVFTEGIGKARVEKVSINELIDFYKVFKNKKF